MGFQIKFTTLVRYTEEPGVTAVTVPRRVRTIENYAFFACHSLTSIVLPPRVRSIGTMAFSYCTGLTSINIPRRVTQIDRLAFDNCTSLPMLTFEGEPDRPFPLPAQYKSLSIREQIALHSLYVNRFQKGSMTMVTLYRILCTLLGNGYREPAFLAAVERAYPFLMRYAASGDAAAFRVLLAMVTPDDEELEALLALAAAHDAKESYLLLVNEKQKRGLLTEDARRL